MPCWAGVEKDDLIRAGYIESVDLHVMATDIADARNKKRR